jgi:hypothetical protein
LERGAPSCKVHGHAANVPPPDAARTRPLHSDACARSGQETSGGARGETLEQARKSVRLDEFRRAFAGDSRVRRNIFDNYVIGAGLAAAYADAAAKR